MKHSYIFKKSFLLGCIFMFCLTSLAYGQDEVGEVESTVMVEEPDVRTLIKEDTIDLGFNKKSKKDIVGAVSSVRPDNYLEYDNSQRVRDAIRGRVPGVYGSDNIRGLGNALIVVDGIPGRFIDVLNAEEIEEITVLKDANAVAQYGAMGKNGVIVVTTKRGKANHREANVIVNYGLRDPISMPNYLGSAEYMELFNEARLNDGLDSAFSMDQINNYRSGANPYKYPNVDFYSGEYQKSYTNYVNALAEFSGGNDNTQYYVNLGYNGSGSIAKLNPEANRGYHRFNVRGNIDFKVNNFIKSSLDVVSIFASDKSAHSNLYAAGHFRKPYTFSPLLPVSMIDTAGNSELAGQVEAANIYNGGYLLGGSQAFQNYTPVATVLAAGYREDITRVTQFNNAIDFDLGMLAEGLSAKTYVSFDFYNIYALSVNNDYSIYEPTWSNDTIVALNRLGEQDQKDQTENANTRNFLTRYGFYGMLNYDKQFGEKHRLNTSLIGFANSMHVRGQKQPAKNAHLALQISYSYDNKLLLDFSSAYVNSVKLPEGNRGKFSPTMGLAYILSEESFLQNSSWLNYLKLRASAGIINTDMGIGNYFMYREIYQQGGGGYSWADGFNNQSTRIQQGRNDDFTFEQRKDLNLGFEAALFNRLWVEMNVFQSDIDNQVTKLNNQYPSYYSDFMPFSNYNQDRYKGFELGINYTDNFGPVRADIGAQVMYITTERVRVDEKYNDQYQYREGLPIDIIWGLEDQGFYTANDFNEDGSLNDGLAVPAFGAVQPGDIKYIDQNNDGVVNQQDQVNIGKWTPPWVFGTNMRFEYKGLSLFVLGTASTGYQAMLSGNYYWVEGDDKYSEVVRNRWTEETAATATYPRLSSQENNHNFRTSTFWMYEGTAFSISRAQLTYQFPQKWINNINMKGLSVYAAGSNLLLIAENSRERQLSLGSEPLYRTYSLGLRAKF